MDLIARYRNAGFEAVADGVMAFFDRRIDLQRQGVAFGPGGGEEPAKVSTDISLVAIDRFHLKRLIKLLWPQIYLYLHLWRIWFHPQRHQYRSEYLT